METWGLGGGECLTYILSLLQTLSLSLSLSLSLTLETPSQSSLACSQSTQPEQTTPVGLSNNGRNRNETRYQLLSSYMYMQVNMYTCTPTTFFSAKA